MQTNEPVVPMMVSFGGKQIKRKVVVPGASNSVEKKPKLLGAKTPAEKSVDNRAPLWNPVKEEYVLIRELGELGWPSPRVAEALGVTAQQFAGAILRYPRIKEEYEFGVANCKGFADRELAWRPMPADIVRVQQYAKRGLGVVEIAAKMGISRQAFQKRLGDTAQLREALESGEGLFRAGLLEDSQELLDNRDPDLKYVASILIFKLKAHCGLSDKPETQPLTLEGKIEHTHRLNLPKPIPVDQMAEFAKIEMHRATEISAQRLKVSEPESVTVEVLE